MFGIASISKKIESLVVGYDEPYWQEWYDDDEPYKCNMEWRVPRHFLQSLSTKDNPVFSTLRSFEANNLSRFYFTSESSQHVTVASILAQCPRLESIKISHCTSDFLEALMQLVSPSSDFKTIHFSRPEATVCSYGYDDESIHTLFNVTDAHMAQLGVNCPNLTSLSVPCSEKFTNAGLHSLQNCSKLVTLNLEANKYCNGGCGVADAGLFHLSGNTSLTSISLVELDITDVGISCLAKNLKFLSVVRCTKVAFLSRNLKCPELKTLSLKDNKVSPAGLLELSKMCPHLTELELHSETVTNATIHAFISRCPHLTTLKLQKYDGSGPMMVTDECKDQMRAARPLLKIKKAWFYPQGIN